MKKLSIFAASLAAMILLTACPNKPNEPQPLQLSDVVGRYEGTHTVEVQKIGDPATEQHDYMTFVTVAPSDNYPYRLLPGYMALVIDTYLLTVVSVGQPYWYGNFGGEVSHGLALFHSNYEIETRWGIVPVTFDYGPNAYGVWIEGDAPVTIRGENLSLSYADTVRDYIDPQGQTCTLVFSHTFRASRAD